VARWFRIVLLCWEGYAKASSLWRECPPKDSESQKRFFSMRDVLLQESLPVARAGHHLLFSKILGHLERGSWFTSIRPKKDGFHGVKRPPNINPGYSEQ